MTILTRKPDANGVTSLERVIDAPTAIAPEPCGSMSPGATREFFRRLGEDACGALVSRSGEVFAVGGRVQVPTGRRRLQAVPAFFVPRGSRAKLVKYPYTHFSGASPEAVSDAVFSAYARSSDGLDTSDLDSGSTAFAGTTNLDVVAPVGTRTEYLLLVVSLYSNQFINQTDLVFEHQSTPIDVSDVGSFPGATVGPWELALQGDSAVDVLVVLGRRVGDSDLVWPRTSRVQNGYDGDPVNLKSRTVVTSAPTGSQVRARVPSPTEAIVLEYFEFMEQLNAGDPSALAHLRRYFPAAHAVIG